MSPWRILRLKSAQKVRTLAAKANADTDIDVGWREWRTCHPAVAIGWLCCLFGTDSVALPPLAAVTAQKRFFEMES